MPKTLEAERIERVRVARMTPGQKANYINSLRSWTARNGGGIVASRHVVELLRESDEKVEQFLPAGQPSPRYLSPPGEPSEDEA